MGGVQALFTVQISNVAENKTDRWRGPPTDLKSSCQPSAPPHHAQQQSKALAQPLIQNFLGQVASRTQMLELPHGGTSAVA